jgi:hypothetical protein
LGSNYYFLELIWSNQGLNCINIEVWWPIRDLIEDIRNQGPNWKRRVNRGAVINQIRGQIEEIRSLLIHWGSNCINRRPRTKVEKAANYKGDDWSWKGCNRNEQKINKDWFGSWHVGAIFKWNGAFCPKRRRFML